jgi:hypothetical protein
MTRFVVGDDRSQSTLFAVIANAAYERGLITFATLIVGMILIAGATCLIAAKTNP